MWEGLHGFVEKAGLSFDVKVLNSLVSMYGKCGDVEVARRLFECTTLKSLVTWNSLLAVYAANGCKEEAFGLFRDMRMRGFGADGATLLSLVHVCTMWGLARQGKAVHAYALGTGFGSDVPIATAVMHLYAKTGDLSSSHFVFYEIDRPDVLAWTTMIAACAVHGQGREAIDVFWGMINDGVSPDHVTFTHVLSACSHTGLVEEGKKYFNIMIKHYGIEPTVEHYSCLVYLLGRAGLLIEARRLIESMPFEPNSAVWGAMLASCRLHRDIQFGKEAAEKFALNPSDANNYIVLFNMLLREGMWREASKIRCLMKERGLRKDSGCSFVEHKNHIVGFVVGDRSHPLSNEIYAKLDELLLKMSSAGYVPITEYVLHDVDEDLKEHMLGVHSEKLAIAFGLIVIADVAPIVVMKNLRICGDCHLAAKFISAIEKRTLIIRDTKRFHRFAHGKCSCEDYW